MPALRQFAVALLGIALAQPLASGDAAAVPPPLTGLPEGRGSLDWSRAGSRDGIVLGGLPPPRFNLRDFGAVGDGIADDTAAFQAALAAAHADPAGGVVLLPAGTYVLQQPLEIRRAGIVLRGEGEGATTVRIPLALADVFPGSWDGGYSVYSMRGAFFQFFGDTTGSSEPSTRLSLINAEVEPGAHVLPVDSPAAFQVGQLVRAFVNDYSTDPTLLPPYPAAQPAPGAASATSQLLPPAAGAPAPLLAPPTAPPPSIVEWIYGEGLAYAGAGRALDRDECSLTARVTAIGDTWVALDRALPFPVRRGWNGEVHASAPPLQDSGVEGLTILFNHSLAGPHLTERGFNAIDAWHAANLRFQNLTILNADNGLRLTQCDHSTLADITVGVTAPRWGPADADPVNGHNAFSMTEGHANLLTRFNVSAPYHHDVSLAGGALLNVISAGAGADLNLDLHRAASWANLFSDLDFGLGSRPFKSGGRADRGAHAGRWNVFWNLRASEVPQDSDAAAAPEGSSAPSRRLRAGEAGSDGGGSNRDGGSGSRKPKPLRLPRCDFGPLLSFVGEYRARDGDKCGSAGWLVEELGDAPADLHAAQVAERAAQAASKLPE